MLRQLIFMILRTPSLRRFNMSPQNALLLMDLQLHL